MLYYTVTLTRKFSLFYKVNILYSQIFTLRSVSGTHNSSSSSQHILCECFIIHLFSSRRYAYFQHPCLSPCHIIPICHILPFYSFSSHFFSPAVWNLRGKSGLSFSYSAEDAVKPWGGGFAMVGSLRYYVNWNSVIELENWAGLERTLPCVTLLYVVSYVCINVK